jgi:hypothetical protein
MNCTALPRLVSPWVLAVIVSTGIVSAQSEPRHLNPVIEKLGACPRNPRDSGNK